MASIILNPGETLCTEIVIQTRIGNKIENVQEHELTILLKKEVETRNKEYKDRVTFVNNASPIYNCHGLTFGSRRSRIWNPQEVAKILREDDYIEIDGTAVQQGDIIIYYGEDGDIEHSGLVVGMANMNTPLILSKWGYGREVVHRYHTCPYESSAAKYYRISK